MKSEIKEIDVETKIRLLIALINDAHRSKLEGSMEKLTNRLTEYFPNYPNMIKLYLIQS